MHFIPGEHHFVQELVPGGDAGWETHTQFIQLIMLL